ncbi:hypothetical protein E2562_038567 [Oryza meyeriana var. granulata]|uniref:non-specific serine/threonine protein kinase n=1 Tax=Oryza meyeriana var. granulata TaxID=110450 RepID=A0A6G1FGS8_9ORYZ|nr:hypothetical protein E2562_038567 [Oryza meyeriana var. granulata]
MALNVSSKGLGGSIPPCIGNLSSIASLDLSSNGFIGKIPTELRRLGQISYLNLSINSLEGRIPDKLSSCSNIQVLGLWNNSLQEYGMGGQISKKGDVYSYGVLLLEILTGKRPTDENFKDGLSLHELVDAAFPHRVAEILNPNMLHNDLDGGNSEVMQSCVLPLVKMHFHKHATRVQSADTKLSPQAYAKLESSNTLTSQGGADLPNQPSSAILRACAGRLGVAVAHPRLVFSGGAAIRLDAVGELEK